MLLLVTIITSLFWSTSYQCDVDCHKLFQVPGRWTRQNSLVPSIALMCSINSTCSVDIKEVMRNCTENLEQAEFFTGDLYFSCMDHKLGKSSCYLIYSLLCYWA